MDIDCPLGGRPRLDRPSARSYQALDRRLGYRITTLTLVANRITISMLPVPTARLWPPSRSQPIPTQGAKHDFHDGNKAQLFETLFEDLFLSNAATRVPQPA